MPMASTCLSERFRQDLEWHIVREISLCHRNARSRLATPADTLLAWPEAIVVLCRVCGETGLADYDLPTTRSSRAQATPSHSAPLEGDLDRCLGAFPIGKHEQGDQYFLRPVFRSSAIHSEIPARYSITRHRCRFISTSSAQCSCMAISCISSAICCSCGYSEIISRIC